MELNDEGAALLASACKLLQGPAGTILSPEQCKFVNADFMVSFWLVSFLCWSSHASAQHLCVSRRASILTATLLQSVAHLLCSERGNMRPCRHSNGSDARSAPARAGNLSHLRWLVTHFELPFRSAIRRSAAWCRWVPASPAALRTGTSGRRCALACG